MKVKPPYQRRRGYALLVVIVQVTLLTALWGVAYRQLASTIRFTESLSQKYSDEKGSLSDIGLKPLTRALILLETGDPADGTSYGVTVPGPNGNAFYFIVTYVRDETSGQQGGNRWNVHSQQVPTLEEFNSYGFPIMPYSL